MKKKKPNFWKIGRIGAATLVLFASGLAFSGFGGAVANVLHFQFGPALMKCFAAFSLGTLSVALGIALLTFLFGRFYCVALCPFGILQDVVGFLSHRKAGKTSKAAPAPNFQKTRYAIAAVAFGMLFAGWSGGFLLLDPYSNFGRIFGAFTLGGVIPLSIIIALTLWKKRIYCTAICPVGTLLGLLAKHGVFKLAITGKCVKCGTCIKNCPTGCIDIASGTIDNERCIRCMNCISACPLHGIHFTRTKKEPATVDKARRKFLVNGGIMLAGFAAGTTLAGTGLSKLAEWAKQFKILPPGAGDAERFASKCTACQLCTANCPSKIIVHATGGDGPVSLDLSRGACLHDCNKCSQVCPTGALRPLSLETKQKTKIAEATFHPQTCIVFQESRTCGKCAEVCPTNAITLRKTGAPRLNVKLCIGCGACQAVCPATQKAMTVHEIEKQILLEA